MICVALSINDADQCIEALKSLEMAEIRIDLAGYNEQQVERVFSSHKNLIATCRPDNISDEKRLKLLIRAIESGAAFVDVEYESDLSFKHAIKQAFENKNCKLIISYHDFKETPAREQLEIIVQQCFDMGADIAKLACMVNTDADNAALLSLYGSERPVVSLGMGEKGKISRIAAPLLGSPFTFAAYDEQSATAPGQIQYKRLAELYSFIKNS